MNAFDITKNKNKILISAFKEIIEDTNIGESISPNELFNNPKRYIKKIIQKNDLLKEVWAKSNEGEKLIDINNLFTTGNKETPKRTLINFVILVNYQKSLDSNK